LLRSHGLRAVFFLASGFLDRRRIAWWDEIAWMARHATASELPANEWLDAPIALVPAAKSGSSPRNGDVVDAAIAALVQTYKRLPADRADQYLDELAVRTGAGRCPEQAGRSQWMTWEMARKLRDSAMAVGGHTVTHPLLARVTEERQREEINGCAQRLAAELNQPMRWFAYPVGSRDAFTRRTVELVRDAGVELAFSFFGGYAASGSVDRLAIPRMHVGPAMTPARLRATLSLPQLFARPDASGT
jgi:peptidoglycan/xylan/chitin deacetylase (PgdA/CDA1 family)